MPKVTEKKSQRSKIINAILKAANSTKKSTEHTTLASLSKYVGQTFKIESVGSLIQAPYKKDGIMVLQVTVTDIGDGEISKTFIPRYNLDKIETGIRDGGLEEVEEGYCYLKGFYMKVCNFKSFLHTIFYKHMKNKHIEPLDLKKLSTYEK